METTANPPSRLEMVYGQIVFAGIVDRFPLIANLNGEKFIVRVHAKPARHLGKVMALALDEAAMIDFTAKVQCRNVGSSDRRCRRAAKCFPNGSTPSSATSKGGS